MSIKFWVKTRGEKVAFTWRCCLCAGVEALRGPVHTAAGLSLYDSDTRSTRGRTGLGAEEGGSCLFPISLCQHASGCLGKFIVVADQQRSRCSKELPLRSISPFLTESPGSWSWGVREAAGGGQGGEWCRQPPRCSLLLLSPN